MTDTTSSLPYEVFTLPDFRLQCGMIVPELRLAYQTYGTLNAARSNVILYPTSYGAQHPDIDWLIQPDGILDPERYFIIIPNMFGNGLSSSPSNLPEPFGPGRWPLFTHVDNVTAQRKLLTEVFGIERLALAYGWSMGGQQALHWGAMFPKCVERIAAICTAAKTSPHSIVFLEGLRSVLTCDPAWSGDRFTARPERGLRAFGRVYAGWALSQAFYREHVYLKVGYSSLEDFLIRDWEASFLRRDAANLLSMIETWKRSDISDNDRYQGDLTRALASIQARTLIMPGSMDLYFTAEDSQAEAQQIPNAEFRPIPSIWGHRAGNPVKSPQDQGFIRTAIAELLSA
ncbi:alpha/beta fold hydrolase [bacterium]|nr:alpha/beta fold hydrolase [bacterium]